MIIKTSSGGRIFVYFNNGKVKILNKSDDLVFKDVWYEFNGKLIASFNSKIFSNNGKPLMVELLVGNLRLFIILNMASYIRNKSVIVSIVDDRFEEVVFEDLNEIEVEV